jgi:LysR family transcriptional regulator (chromosome initiation inhibitor)
MDTLDPDQLTALATAVTEGTFEAAARALHVTPSAVSQRIKALETTVGRVLLVRSKPIQATEPGQLLVRLAGQMRVLTEEVVAELNGQDDRAGVIVSLAVNADSLATWALPALVGLGPPLLLDLHREDEERTADLLRDGTVMAAITASAERVPGCTAESLGRMRYRPCAAATFIKRWFPDGVTVSALAEAPVVVFDRADTLQDRYLQRRSRRPLDPPRHHIPGSVEFVEAVKRGLGWGMLPDLQLVGAAGRRLVELDARGVIDVELYWQQWRLSSAALDRVAGAVREAARANLV